MKAEVFQIPSRYFTQWILESKNHKGPSKLWSVATCFHFLYFVKPTKYSQSNSKIRNNPSEMFKALLKVVLFFFFKSSKSCQNHKQNFIVEKYHGMVLKQSIEKPLDAGAAVRFPASAPLLRFFLSSVWIPSVTAISATKKTTIKSGVCRWVLYDKERTIYISILLFPCLCMPHRPQ